MVVYTRDLLSQSLAISALSQPNRQKSCRKNGFWGSAIAAPNRKSLATFHRTLESQCSIALSSVRNRAISGVRNGHRNRKSQKSLRFRCAKAYKHSVLTNWGFYEFTFVRDGPYSF